MLRRSNATSHLESFALIMGIHRVDCSYQETMWLHSGPLSRTLAPLSRVALQHIQLARGGCGIHIVILHLGPWAAARESVVKIFSVRGALVFAGIAAVAITVAVGASTAAYFI